MSGIDFEKLFPNTKDPKAGHWFDPPSYNEIVETLAPEILLEVADGGYQGDSRFLLRDGARYGWLQFGWGSCSGCDSLQACNTRQDLRNLWEGLRDNIKWFDSKGEAARFFKEHDWKGDYSWHDKEQREFVKKASDILADDEAKA